MNHTIYYLYRCFYIAQQDFTNASEFPYADHSDEPH